ncbi:M48 metallopeptidase family protein [Hymenobacter crusticola]|uniref:YgjP-like metallopeptidase domain-containing protein n=1 Tax=Hymenobacter crusticola TaxID=1770526 RepID=A0A243W619_9BACT|nr:M48 family metallopeptidase [Hymenobacter crusticola]OUJ69394.1 hypothetical protein BXP70_26520 [Hymenobacter crusticola]
MTEVAFTSIVSLEQPWRDVDDLKWAARHWAARLGVTLRRLTVRPMRHKWASISTVGRLTLDANLLKVPRHLGEFVIVHELVHLLCPKSGHGRVFKAFLSAYLPNWKTWEQELQQHASNTYRAVKSHKYVSSRKLF